MSATGTATTGRREPSARARRWATAIPPVAVLVVIVLGWWALSTLLLSDDSRFLLPPPDEVVRVGFLDARHRAELFEALALSAQVALVGLAISAVLGVTAAVAMVQARWVERSFYPYAVVLQTVPTLALVPLFGFWFGFGLPSRVLVCVMVSLFPIVANTLFGLRSASPDLHELFALHGAGRRATLLKLQLPSALPSIFTGLRISAGLSVIGAVVGDYFFKQGQLGLGILIDIYRQRLQSEQLFAAVLLTVGLGVAVFLVFNAAARRVSRRFAFPD